jgi:branched-chain amino acid transport system substrate-binding protein
MFFSKVILSIGLVAGVVLAGASSSSAETSSGGEPTETVGVLADLTGVGAVTGDTTTQGIKAGVGLAATEDYHVKYVIADTTSTLSGALSAAQMLVEEDHVFAVIMISQLGFAAAPYLAKNNIPVVGVNVDGPEWLTDRNMFSVYGFSDYTRVSTEAGKIYKLLGGTEYGGAAYSISPASYDSEEDSAKSAQLAGLKVAYQNTVLPYGTTNVAPVALAMKSAGVNILYPSIAQASSFALVQALKQEGVNFKAVLPTGYGGDLIEGGPDAKQIAQDVYFTDTFEPSEMHTAATEKLQKALKAYAGVTTDPTLNEYAGYLSIDGLVQGLKAAGKNPTQAEFINAMLGIHHYDAQGLWGGRTLSFALEGRGAGASTNNCEYTVQYRGTSFHLVSGAEPVCGTIIPGHLKATP